MSGSVRRNRGNPVPYRDSWCTAVPTPYLASFPFLGPELIYSDPPYLHAARRSSRRCRFEYEEADHVALLELLKGLPCQVMVSGHPSALYDDLLTG